MVGTGDVSNPPAVGVRLAWEGLPAHVRTAIEGWLGAAVVSAESQASGFSPGVAARLQTADGRRVFVKAVGPEPNPTSPAFHRREIRIVGALPAETPVPRLLWSYDEDGWVVLVFEEVAGQHPAMPWRPDELERVMAALADLATALTPSPVPETIAESAVAWELLRQGWWDLVGKDAPAGLDEWSARHLQALVDLERDAAEAVAGKTLLHLDVRADNLLLTPERVIVVDWPHARIGAAWLDLLAFAPSVAMQGGPEPEDLLAHHPAARAADPAAINAALAAIAGVFTRQSLQPDPPGLPTLRAFQAAQGVIARRWLAERMGWT